MANHKVSGVETQMGPCLVGHEWIVNVNLRQCGLCVMSICGPRSQDGVHPHGYYDTTGEIKKKEMNKNGCTRLEEEEEG